jgi:hypothetical protein
MSDLESYFGIEASERDSHPLIRLLDQRKGTPEFREAKVQILRPRAALGFEPARLTLQFYGKQMNMYDYKTESWDTGLKDALIDRGIRAIDESNEIQRFGLSLAASLQQPENRYGDGFFSSVLVLVVDQSPFANKPPVRELRPYISTNKPYEGGRAAGDCSVMIQATLQDRWIELRRDLAYEKTEAERILAGALAYYLDERFGVTDGRKLGWLRA